MCVLCVESNITVNPIETNPHRKQNAADEGMTILLLLLLPVRKTSNFLKRSLTLTNLFNS